MAEPESGLLRPSAGKASVLEEIVASCRKRLEARMHGRSLAGLLEAASPSQRGLTKALQRPGARFILEMKRRSPSRGNLRPLATVQEMSAAYRGLADAVSVLTEPDFFGGSLTDLEQMSSAIDIPILQKDFILDPFQIVDARLHGADAVLLMLSVVNDRTARECLEMCEKLRVDALVEVHDEEELQRAIELDVPLIGINNRDLRTLEVDPTTTERLAPRVPDNRILVAESGIASAKEVARLAPLVDGFLVGSSLMVDPDLRGAAAALVSGRIKICGLTRAEDAVAAARIGAWRLGAVLAPDSPRRTTPEAARRMTEATELPTVAVFRSQAVDEIARLADEAGAPCVQIHQDLSIADIQGLRDALPGVEIWGATGFTPNRKVEAIPTLPVDRMVLDAAVNGRSGGTGRQLDWERFSHLLGFEKTILAGGIRPDNALRARNYGAYALDLSSGVESEPGIKDHRKLAALQDALRAASSPDFRHRAAPDTETSP